MAWATSLLFTAPSGPRLMGLKPDEPAIEAAMAKARTVFEELARLLGQQSYFAAKAVSLADILLALAIEFSIETPEWKVLGAPHAHLVSWLARMAARPSVQASTWERMSEMANAINQKRCPKNVPFPSRSIIRTGGDQLAT